MTTVDSGQGELTVTVKPPGEIAVAIEDPPDVLVEVVTGPTIEVDVSAGGMPGPPGPQGPPGEGALRARQYNFAVPSVEWIVVHDLNSSNVEVNVYDSSGSTQYDTEVEITDASTVTVRWYYPQSGIVRVLG